MPLPIVAGLARALGYLAGPFFLLTFVAFVPLLAWFDAHPGASARRRFRAGFLFGLATYVVLLHFMYAMAEYSPLAWVLYASLALALAVRVGLTAVLLGWLRERTGVNWGVLLPAVWISAEWLQSWGDLRLTGDHVANTLSRAPFLIQFVDVTGPYGAGALALIVNGLLFEIWRSRSAGPGARRSLVALVLLALGVLSYDSWAWRRTPPDRGTLRVGLVQPNVPILVKRGDRENSDEWSRLVELTLAATDDDARVVIWPETARPLPLLHRPEHPSTFSLPEVADLSRATGAAILSGVDYVRFRPDGRFDRFNAAMGVDADGRLLETWGAKVYLVPFTEGVPFEALLGSVFKNRGGEWRWLAGGFTPGENSAVIELAGERIGALVCYEQLFADLARSLRRRGAALQVVITNDAWFGRTYFQGLQADVLRMRAIENRTEFVRVANTGISGFIDRKGRYRERTELFEKDVRVADVALAGPPTIYVRFGDVSAWVALAVAVGLVLLARRAGHAAPPDGIADGS